MKRLFWGAGVLLLLVLLLRPVLDFDVWYDLRMGENILRTHHITHTTTFLWTQRTFPPYWSTNDEWGFGVLVRLLWGMGGLNALSLLMAALATAMLTLGAWLAGRRGAGLLPIVISVAAGWWLIQPRLMPRPQLLTDFMLTIYLAIAMLRPGRWWWLWPPALMVLWVNCHAGALAGVLLLAGLLGGAGLERAWDDVRLLAKCCGLTLLATTLCPSGWHLAGYVVQHFFLRTLPMTWVEEWRPIGLDNWPFWLFVLFGVVGMLKGRAQARYLVVFLGFAFLAWRHERGLGELVAVGVPLMAIGLSALRPIRLPEWSWGLAGGLMLLAVPFVYRPLHQDLALCPVAAVSWMESHQIPEEIFNTYHFGGYLTWAGWPNHLPFIHGITNVFPDEILRAYQQITYGNQATLDRYGVQAMLLGYPITPGDSTGICLDWVEKSPQWKLVYFDDTALVYVRRSPRFASLPAYDHVLPGKPGSWDPADPEVVTELQRAVQDAPSVCARCWLGDSYRKLGELARAESLYLEAGDSYMPHARLGQLLFARGDLPQALANLQAAWRETQPNAPDAYNLAVAYARMQDTGSASHWVRKALSLDPGFAPARTLAAQLH
ncbi:MAG: tetratricopeptide repeat protein [Candidatus Xenobia bacterium]